MLDCLLIHTVVHILADTFRDYSKLSYCKSTIQNYNLIVTVYVPVGVIFKQFVLSMAVV